MGERESDIPQNKAPLAWLLGVPLQLKNFAEDAAGKLSITNQKQAMEIRTLRGAIQDCEVKIKEAQKWPNIVRAKQYDERRKGMDLEALEAELEEAKARVTSISGVFSAAEQKYQSSGKHATDTDTFYKAVQRLPVKEALGHIERCRLITNLALSHDRTSNEIENENKRDAPIYEAKLARYQDVIDFLDETPGADAVVVEMKKVKSAAESFAADGDYVSALKALKTGPTIKYGGKPQAVGGTGKLKRIGLRKSQEFFAEKVPKDGQLDKLIKLTHDELQDLRKEHHRDVAEKERTLTAILKQYAEKGANEEAASKAVDLLFNAIRNENVRLDGAKKNAETQIGVIAKLIEAHGPKLSPVDESAFDGVLNSAISLAGNGFYEEATAALDGVEGKLKQKIAEVQKDQATWVQAKTSFKAKLVQFEKLHGRMQVMNDALQDLSTKAGSSALPYSVATAQVEQLARSLATLKLPDNPAETLQELSEVGRQFDGEIKAGKDEVGAFQKQPTGVTAEMKRLVADVSAEIDHIEETWKSQKLTEFNPKNLQAVAQGLKAELDAQLKLLTPEGIVEALKGAKEKDADDKAFAQARDAAKAAIDKWEEIDPDGCRETHDKWFALTHADSPDAAAMTAIKNDAEKGMKEVEDAQKASLKSVNDAVQKLQEKLKSLPNVVQEAVTTQIKELQAVATEESSAAMLEASKALVAELDAKVGKLKGAKPNDYKEVKEKKEKIEKDLDKVGEKRREELKKELESLTGDNAFETPHQQLLSLEQFALKTVAPAIADTEQGEKDRAKSKKQLPVIEGLIKGLYHKDAYCEQARAQRDAFKARLATEGGEGRLLKEIQDFVADLEKVVKDDDLLSGREGEALKAKKQKRLAEQEWKGRLVAFEKDKRAAAAAIEAAEKQKAGSADQELLMRLGNIVEEAEQLAKDKSFDAAMDKLGEAKAFAQEIATAPEGQGVFQGKSLRGHEKRWMLAVQGFVGTVTELQNAVQAGKSADEAESEKAADLAKLELGHLHGLFASDAFSSIVKRVKSDKDGQRHAAEREKGLKVIRRYRRSLKSDPLIKEFRLNPFGIPDKPDIQKLITALNNLEQGFNELG